MSYAYRISPNFCGWIFSQVSGITQVFVMKTFLQHSKVLGLTVLNHEMMMNHKVDLNHKNFNHRSLEPYSS